MGPNRRLYPFEVPSGCVVGSDDEVNFKKFSTLSNVWPAPSVRDNWRQAFTVCFDVSGLGEAPRGRCRSAQPGPCNYSGLDGRSILQASKLPFDCLAIFLLPYADLGSYLMLKGTLWLEVVHFRHADVPDRQLAC